MMVQSYGEDGERIAKRVYGGKHAGSRWEYWVGHGRDELIP